MKSKQDNDDLKSSAHVNNSEKSFSNQEYGKNVLSSQNNESLCTQEKLELSSWGLPEKVLEFYKKKGITRMFQWQLECLTLGGVLDAGNLVYSAPTSAGKTLVAEILTSKTVFELQKKALVILPFVSVVREKMFYFQSMYASSGVRVEGYMGGHSPSIPFKQVNVAVCTIEKANSIINRLLEEHSLQTLGLVVVDELHLLGDPYRGYLLELLLTKLKYISSKSEFKIQIVGMSATLPNLKSLADWLNAELYYTDFRPVPLNETLKCGTLIYDKKLNKLSELTPLPSEGLDDSENVGQLCLETIANGHSVLIFCPTKVWCENLADKISMFFRKNGCSKSAENEGTPGWILRKQINLKKINEVIDHLKMCPVGLDKDLQKTVSYGVAFHHAGLTLDERDIIEGSFRQGSIRVLCATSTLSSGVNLPARRVIIRSPMSFGGLMDILTYRQMIGRAGRMGVDSEGESILICKPNEKAMCQTLMCSNLKPIESCLGHGRLSASLKRALLEIIASEIASNPEEIAKYASCTFLASSSKHNIEDPIQSCLEFLEENEFIRLQDNGTLYIPTPLGRACLASSLPPDEGLALFRELQRARRCFVLDTDLHIIYQVTPYSVSEQWSKVDWLNVLNILEGLPPSMKRVGEMVGVEESFLVRVVKGNINPNDPENRNKLSIHRRFYTSLALQDLVNEVPLAEVAEKYECNKGMLQSLQQSAATYAGMVTEFTKRLGWGSVELIFSQFQERLQFGIQRELCELMRLPLLNAMRARALFNAGFTSLSAIASAEISELENAFLAMVPFQSKKQIAGETNFDREQRNKLETVWITGKSDLSIREAAEQLLMESRNILEVELGLEGAQWGRKAAEKSVLNESHYYNTNHSSVNKIAAVCESNVETVPSNSRNEKNEIVQSTVISQERVKEEENQKLAVIELDNNEIKFQSEVNNINQNSDGVNLINCNIESINSSKLELSNEINNKSVMKSQNVNNVASNADEGNDCKFKETEFVCPKEDSNKILDNLEAVEFNESGKDGEKSEKAGSRTFTVGQHEEIDYFASSFNFDIVLEYDTSKQKEVQANSERREFSRNNNIVECSSSEDCSSDSVEILFDSTINSGTKNFSFSRLSEDMFDISKRGGENSKKMSTPISSHGHRNVRENEINQSRLGETRSPDLFSQSLTFDTQLGKILDFEDHPGEDVPPIVNPSSSLNSDDLGFVSDLSPPKPQGIQKIENGVVPGKKIEDKNLGAGPSDCFIESEFKSPLEVKEEDRIREKFESIKRKANAIDSPDVIVETPGPSMATLHVPKRIKYSLQDEQNNDSSSPKPIASNDSDDEIMPTPRLPRNHFGGVLEIKRFPPHSSIRSVNNDDVIRKITQRMETEGNSNEHTNKINSSKNATTCKLDKSNWDRINVIDVCENEQEFKFFCDELKEQNLIGLALGCCRKAEEKKNVIGARISKLKKTDSKGKSSNCTYKDVVLDGIAFYWRGNDVFYMSLDDGNIPFADKINLLKNMCLSKKTFRVFDAKEQMKMLQRCSSILLTSFYQDPKIGSWLLSEIWKEKNFSALTLEYLPAAKNLVSCIGSIVGYSSPGLLVKSSTSHKTRATLEAFLTYHVMNKQISLLQERGLLKAFENIEMPVMVSLAEMELAGFQICQNRISNINKKLDEIMESLEERAYSLAQHKFSISSSAAVSKVLFKELGLDKSNIALTKKRKVPSTSKQALQDLTNETNHPLPEIILQWRKIKSISSKFVSPLLQISSESTRVFGVSQSFTVTGRISMHEPNIQNIPKNFVLNFDVNEPATEINLREVFVASEECVLLSADYCQIELRILAHLSQDKELIKNITDSSDIFVNIASTIFGVPCYEVDEVLRQRAKQTCYGIIYGVGPQTLSQQLDIEESDALQLMEDFKSKYEGVKEYLDQTVSECRRRGYVSTLMGRRRYLPAINDLNPVIKSEAERQAINTTIQGSAADLVKKALIEWRDGVSDLKSEGVTAHLVLHLHDELIFEVQENAVETVAIILKDVMETAMCLSVPIPVKLRTGPCWGQLESFEL